MAERERREGWPWWVLLFLQPDSQSLTSCLQEQEDLPGGGYNEIEVSADLGGAEQGRLGGGRANSRGGITPSPP